MAQFVSTKCDLRQGIGFVHYEFVCPLLTCGSINPVVSVFPFGTERRLRFLEGLGRKVTAGPVNDVYVDRSKAQARLVRGQAKIQVIEVESELLFEAYMPNSSEIGGQKESIEYDAPLGRWAEGAHYCRAIRQISFHRARQGFCGRLKPGYHSRVGMDFEVRGSG